MNKSVLYYYLFAYNSVCNKAIDNLSTPKDNNYCMNRFMKNVNKKCIP